MLTITKSEKGKTMYKSPIELLTAEIQAKLENGVVDLLKHIDINVDKDELIRALRYDRKQYDNGFSDGRLAGLDEQYAGIVWCADCKYCGKGEPLTCFHPRVITAFGEVSKIDFCSWGKRRDDEQ